MAPVVRIWSRRAGLDAELLQSWRRSLMETAESVPARPVSVRALAWARCGEELCVGSAAYLSIGGAAGWRHLGWHEIERGGWNAETGRLQWRGYDGSRGNVSLTSLGRLPELFRDRVDASIVVKQAVPFGGGSFFVSGRRHLGDPTAPLAWHVTLGRGLSWSTVGLADAAQAALDRVRSEYDPT